MHLFRLLSLFVVCFVLTSACADAQVSVRGSVRDSASRQFLEDATVSLLRQPGPEVLRRARGRREFIFPNLAPASYLLVTTYQGYAPDTTAFVVGPKDSLAIFLAINMKPASDRMMEVVVRASIPPAIVKNDTIAFNAGAYSSPPNSTLEDLLKKLPGIQVDRDGNVTMQGQKVDKITIDGKDFFLGDLRSATQNLPVDIVAQVEAFDTQSERAKLLGIKENSKTKTLNIKLKKDKRKGYYGKAWAGIGTTRGYSAGTTVTRLAPSQLLFGNFNANNINNQFTGRENQNGAGAGVQKFNNAELNWRREWGSKLKMTLNGSRGYSNSELGTEANKQTVLTDSSIVESRASENQNRSTNYNGHAQFEYRLDSFTQVNLHSSYSNSNSNNQSLDTVSIITQKPGSQYSSSLGRTVNSSGGSGNNLSNSLDLVRRFRKKGRLVYLNLAQNVSRNENPAALYSSIQNFDSLGHSVNAPVVNQQSKQFTNNNSYNLSASYTEPVGRRHVLDFNYGYNRSTGHSDKESFNFDSLSGKFDRPDSLTTNRFINHSTVQRFSAGYNTTEGKYRFQLGLTGQLTQLDNLNLVSGSNLHQQSVNWYPRASFLWEVGKGKNFNLAYSGNTVTPSIDQLQPIPDLSNPYLVRLGNPDLRQSLTHDVSMNYSAFNSKSLQNFQARLSGDYAQNQITNASTVLAGGVQEIQAVNVQGVFHLSSDLTYGFPLGGQNHGNASISLRSNYGHDISIINGQTNAANNIGIGGSARANYHAGSKLFVDGEININSTRSDYSLPLSPATQTLNENYRLNVSWRLPLSITLASYYMLQVTGSQNPQPAQAVSLWNASVYKSVFRSHAGEIRVSAFDLLNSARSFSQTVGVNYVQTVRSNLPGRLLLVSFIWRFSGFGV